MPGSRKTSENLGIIDPRFADKILRRIVGFGKLTPLPIDFEELRLSPQARPVRVRTARNRKRLHHSVRNIDTEPVDSTVKPESQNIEEFGANILVTPVEIRLRGVKKMQIPLRVFAPIV